MTCLLTIGFMHVVANSLAIIDFINVADILQIIWEVLLKKGFFQYLSGGEQLKCKM